MIVKHWNVAHPATSYDLCIYLNNLSISPSTRYKHLGTMEDLDEAIVLGREALKLHPPIDDYF